MQLRDLIAGVQLERQIGSLEMEIRGLACHTKDVGSGFVFFALPGYATDGHFFAAQAVAQGATVLVCQRPLPLPVTQLVVQDPRRTMALMANQWFGSPSQGFALVGVTGTNGKTTTTYMLEAILVRTGLKTGLIGSIQYRMPGKSMPSVNTTPDVLTLQGLFREMADGGCKAVVMEVSSHALDQERVTGAAFDLAILSNLTRDHLEYHKNFAAYRGAKAKLFAQVGGAAPAAVLNADDPHWQYFAAASLQSAITTFGLGEQAQLRAIDLRLNKEESRFTLLAESKRLIIRLGVPGLFNVYNALAALAAAKSMGVPLELARDALAEFSGAPGRCEIIRCGQPFTVVVDYAHNPDALEKILDLPLAEPGHRKIVVFGCEGGKDTDRRCLMGEVAGRKADYAIITTDNLYAEDPAQVAGQVAEGVGHYGDFTVILDRREAIRHALHSARPGDGVIIAGKGHETCQVFRDCLIPFDDRQVVRELLGDMVREAGS